MVRDIVNDKARNYVLNQVHIGYPELKSLLTFRFRETWHSEIGDREAGYSEAEHALTGALAAAIHEIQEVRALANEGNSGSDQLGGSLPNPGTASSADVGGGVPMGGLRSGRGRGTPPSLVRRFLQRITRSPWKEE